LVLKDYSVHAFTPQGAWFPCERLMRLQSESVPDPEEAEFI
jgi:hypothetical protein